MTPPPPIPPSPTPPSPGDSDSPRTPEQLELEAQLDLLVDNELSEAERAGLLRSIDRQPAQWRTVALRFLTRQAERTAVRQFISAAPMAEEIPATYPFPAPRGRMITVRNIAALLVVAASAALAGHYFARPTPAVTEVAARTTVSVPGSLVGEEGKSVDVPVSVTSTTQDPTGYFLNAAPLPADEARHLIIAPQGRDHVVVFPISTAAKADVFN